MKFTISKENLQQAVEIVAPAISRKDWSMCQTVQIIASGNHNQVTFTATDGSLSIRASIPAQRVDEVGGVCVPGEPFVNVCKHSLRSEFVHFELKHIKLTVSSESSSWTSKTQASEQFPQFLKWTETYQFDHRLVEGLRKVVVSISKSNDALSGIQLLQGKSQFTLLASNRATISRVAGIPSSKEVVNFYIPDALVQQLLRLKPERLSLHSNEKQLGASFELRGVCVQLAHLKLAGNFPDLTSFFEQLEGEPKAAIKLPTQDMTYACRVASLIIENSQGDPTLTMTFRENIVDIEVPANDHIYRETIPFEGTLPSDTDLTIECQPAVLTNFLRVINEDSFHFQVIDGDKSQVHLWSTEDHDYFYSPYQIRFYKSEANNLAIKKPLRVSRGKNHKQTSNKRGAKSARLKTA